jgi:hypothetical protein
VGGVVYTVTSMTSFLFASSSFCTGSSAFPASVVLVASSAFNCSALAPEDGDSPCFSAASACDEAYHLFCDVDCDADAANVRGASDDDVEKGDDRGCCCILKHCLCWRARVWRVRESRWLIMVR